MFRKNTILIITAVFLVVCSSLVLAITADEIINKRDDNEHYTSARIKADMIVINRNRKMTKTIISISDGGNSLSEFINPRDRGTKFLKRGDELYMFFPDAEDIVHISGHMLNQSMMGSDYSYKDMMESDKLTDLYDFNLLGEEELDGRSCYLLEGIKKEGKENVQYYRRKMWVDKDRFIGLQEELYAQSGRLLKVSKVTKVEKLDDRWFPMAAIMENKLRKNTRTEFIIKTIKFNPELSDKTFTLENLKQ